MDMRPCDTCGALTNRKIPYATSGDSVGYYCLCNRCLPKDPRFRDEFQAECVFCGGPAANDPSTIVQPPRHLCPACEDEAHSLLMTIVRITAHRSDQDTSASVPVTELKRAFRAAGPQAFSILDHRHRFKQFLEMLNRRMNTHA